MSINYGIVYFHLFVVRVTTDVKFMVRLNVAELIFDGGFKISQDYILFKNHSSFYFITIIF